MRSAVFADGVCVGGCFASWLPACPITRRAACRRRQRVRKRLERLSRSPGIALYWQLKAEATRTSSCRTERDCCRSNRVRRISRRPQPLQLSDLQTGDRILVRGGAGPDGKSIVAASVIAMKKADLAAKHAHDQAEWQRHGIGGLVSAVDPTAGTITVSTSALGANKNVVVHVSKNTVLRRYAPGSVKFDDAAAAPIDQIKAGDQLRARGQKSADGGELTADEVVSGSFRNISGTINSIDAASELDHRAGFGDEKAGGGEDRGHVAVAEIAGADGAEDCGAVEGKWRRRSGGARREWWRGSGVQARRLRAPANAGGSALSRRAEIRRSSRGAADCRWCAGCSRRPVARAEEPADKAATCSKRSRECPRPTYRICRRATR